MDAESVKGNFCGVSYFRCISQQRCLPLLLRWVLAGAVAGAVVALGYYLWLGIFAEHPADPWVTNLLVAAGVSWIMLALLLAKMLYIGLTSYASGGRANPDGWLQQP